MTICNWEKGRGGRQLRFIPRIIEFLGCEPTSDSASPTTLGERVKQYRIRRGISQKELAKQVGIDPTTLSRIERNQGGCSESVTIKALNFVRAGGVLLAPE